MKTSLALLALSVLCLACPKRVDTNVAGSDDASLDQLTAQLEELRARVQAQEPQCKDWCSMKGEVTDLAKRLCDLSARNPDRTDMQQKCVSGQEEQARATDGCAPCG